MILQLFHINDLWTCFYTSSMGGPCCSNLVADSPSLVVPDRMFYRNVPKSIVSSHFPSHSPSMRCIATWQLLQVGGPLWSALRRTVGSSAGDFSVFFWGHLAHLFFSKLGWKFLCKSLDWSDKGMERFMWFLTCQVQFVCPSGISRVPEILFDKSGRSERKTVEITKAVVGGIYYVTSWVWVSMT